MNKQTVNKMGGFTLVELIVVIAILGVLAAWGAPKLKGYLESAKGTAMGEAIQTVDEEITSLANTHRISNCATNTRLVAAGNNYLDVIYNGSAFVLAAEQGSYERLPHAINTNAFSEITAAGAGAAGTYEVQGMPFTIQPCTATENVYRLQSVTSDTLGAYLDTYHPAIAAVFDPAVAVNAGAVRYTAADANDEHQVDIYIRR